MSVAVLATLLVASLCASNAVAQVTTILSTQGFTTATAPSGWSESGTWTTGENSAWYWESPGNGGSNGSANEDIWDNSGTLTTPSENVTAYAAAADSVWVDFDFYWEYNEYCYLNEGPDTWKVTANSDVIQTGTESNMYTYYNTTDTYYGASGPSQTSSTNWTHYHLLVPVADRTSTMTITFDCIIGWGESNPAIDNVTITGKNIPPAELSLTPNPKTLNFGTATPNSPDTLYATIKSVGAVGTKLGISSIAVAGASAYSILPGGAKVGDSISVGNSEQVGVQFLPFTSGTLTGTLTVKTTGADSGTQVENLTGVGAVPSVSYSATNMFRGVNVELTDTSSTQYLYVNSTGVGPLTVKSVSFYRCGWW